MDKVRGFVVELVTNDVVIRAVKTFLQAFLAVLVVGVAGVTDVNTGKALVVSAVAAGISAVQNTIKELVG